MLDFLVLSIVPIIASFAFVYSLINAICKYEKDKKQFRVYAIIAAVAMFIFALGMMQMLIA